MIARFAAVALALALVCSFSGAASASGVDLARAKDQGIVGEKADGYVAIVVEESNSLIQAIVRRVNTKRRAAYEEIARRRGTSVDAVSVLAGAKLIERASRGEWVTDTDGAWHRK